MIYPEPDPDRQGEGAATPPGPPAYERAGAEKGERGRWREGDVAFLLAPTGVRVGIVRIIWIAPVEGADNESGSMYGVKALTPIRCHWREYRGKPYVLYAPDAEFTASYAELQKPCQDRD